MGKIEVGVNSYVTLEEAQAYVSTFYMSTSAEFKAWTSETLSDDDKETALIASAQALNNLKYNGRKRVPGQKLAFPRVTVLMPGIYWTPFVVQYADTSLSSCGYGGDNGLESAKAAQIENALAHILYGCTYTTTKKRALSGITSKRVDDVAESYSNRTDLLYEAETGLYAPNKVKALLKSWLDESVFTL